MSFVVNPNTNRLIRVGGSAYRKLIKQQMLDEQKQNGLPAIQQSANPEDGVTEEEYQRQYRDQDPYANLKHVQRKPRKTTAPVRKKIGRRRRQPTQEQISQYTAKAASRAFQNNLGTLTEVAQKCENEDDLGELDSYLQKLILEEMMAKPATAQKNRLQNMKQNMQNSHSITNPTLQEEYELGSDIEYED